MLFKVYSSLISATAFNYPIAAKRLNAGTLDMLPIRYQKELEAAWWSSGKVSNLDREWSQWSGKPDSKLDPPYGACATAR
ncbi:hypothetical protein AVEN_144269-1 [Araneus ventricosus]|uniref:Uncharacterized protein n=1 Tax=Araneus ventricosus TaxID=182803 RepID=A0A4Y2HA42_ARAVE|nr:hypothetical protein AVEN_144269-1 [Araneus ventricosus]